MAKFKKTMLILALCAVCAMAFAGCSLFQLNQERYRSQTVLSTGKVDYTLGQAMSYLDTYLAHYVSAGYDAASVLKSLYPQMVQRLVVLSEYTSGHSEINQSDRAKKYQFGTYLTEDDLIYTEKITTYNYFATLDSSVLSDLKSQGYAFDDAADERVKKTDYGTVESLAKMDFKYDLKKLNRQLAKKYNPADENGEYHYQFAEGDAALEKTLADLNDRLSVDNEKGEVTAEVYLKAQKSALATFEKDAKTNYGLPVDKVLRMEVEEQIFQTIINYYATEVYGQVETAQNLSETLATRWANSVTTAKEKYAANPNSFITDIIGLTSSSFMYDVPAQFAGQFHYVKNLLIPFSDEQSAELTEAKNLYGEDSASYIQYRNQLANSIEVKNYTNDDKGVKEDYTFSVTADGTVSGNFLTEKVATASLEEFTDLIYAYNTDPGMFNNAYDYVISKTEYDVTNSSQDKFVKSFTAAARELANDPSQKYVVCVTDYGIHILYYAGEVVADQFDYAERYNYGVGAGSVSYRFFRNYFDTVKSALFQETMDSKMKSLLEEKGITENLSVLNDYLKKYNITAPSIYDVATED